MMYDHESSLSSYSFSAFKLVLKLQVFKLNFLMVDSSLFMLMIVLYRILVCLLEFLRIVFLALCCSYYAQAVCGPALLNKYWYMLMVLLSMLISLLRQPGK